MDSPVHDLCRIVEHGGLFPDGHIVEPARVTVLGSTPGETYVKAMVWKQLVDEEGEPTEDRSRFHQWDYLTGCTVTEHDDGSFTVEGVSTKMCDDVHLEPDQAGVRWLVTPGGCKSCR